MTPPDLRLVDDANAAELVAEALAARHRVLLVCSNGGHLAQLHRLSPWWHRHEREWVTFAGADTDALLPDERVTVAHSPTTRNPRNLVLNLGLALRVLRRRRPDVVVSNGAGVAVPFFLAARLLGIPTVYLEVYDRVTTTTMSGRLCKPLSTLFLVQWPEQRSLYPGSAVVGAVL
jgi:UDP-N-acetylglucosamine:LPS N-acetylglucosamine transferase